MPNLPDIRVSVLTSCYHHEEKYVRQCLDSLCAQTLQECEFILIDNGADAVNKALIAEYLNKDSRFRAIYIKDNIGMGAALNKGIEAARGEYIGFLESDDFTEPSMFEDLFQKAQETKADVVKSLFKTVDESGNVSPENRFPPDQLGVLLKRGECSGMIQGHVSHWSGIYKKDFLLRNNILFNETPGGHSQDFGFILQCYAFAESVYIIPCAYVGYRLFTGVHSAKFLNDCMLDECELTLKKLRDTSLPTQIWEVLFLRISLRLKDVIPTADKSQLKRIVKELLSDEKYQHYKLFSREEKKAIKELIHPYLRLKNLFTVKRIHQKKKIKIFGITVVKIKKTDRYKKVYLFGVPVYYKKKKLFPLLQLLHSLNDKNILLENKLNALKTVVEVQGLHKETFGKYKNAFAGKDVVLVCTGPTAKYYKPIDNAIHVGVNGAVYLDKIKLDYLFMQDGTMRQKNNSALNEDCVNYKGNNCIKFFGIIPDDRLEKIKPYFIERVPLSCAYRADASQYYLEDWYQHNVAHDLSREPLGDFGGTAFSALQFILYAHPKRLYLVGWDCSSGYAYNKKNALEPANQQAVVMKEHFLPFIDINYPDIEIISVNPVGLGGVFKEVYTKDYADEHNNIPGDDIKIVNIEDIQR